MKLEFKSTIYLIIIALITWIAWSFGFSKVFYKFISVAGISGMYEYWASLLSISFLFGFIPALAVCVVVNIKVIPLAVFFGCVIVLLTLGSSFLLGGLQATAPAVKSFGFWVYIFGAFMGVVTSKRVFQTNQ